MKIAFISYEYPSGTGTGGIGIYVYQVTRLLLTVNIEVHIFTGSHRTSETLTEDGVTLHTVKCSGPNDFKFLVLPAFRKEHAARPFDLIESPEIHSNALEIKKEFTSVPLIVRLHACDYLVESFKKKIYATQK